MKEIKINRIKPIVERIDVTLSNIKYYKKDILEDKIKIEYYGDVIFSVDLDTGIAHSCRNVGKFKFTTGRGFWKQCFREQVSRIEKLCLKAATTYNKQLKNE